MNDPYLKNEWESLCDRLRKCAESIANNDTEKLTFSEQADDFARREAPTSYQDLLDFTAASANIAKQWRNRCESDVAHREEMLDESLEESFPASDPPAFGHVNT